MINLFFIFDFFEGLFEVVVWLVKLLWAVAVFAWCHPIVFILIVLLVLFTIEWNKQLDKLIDEPTIVEYTITIRSDQEVEELRKKGLLPPESNKKEKEEESKEPSEAVEAIEDNTPKSV